MIDRRLETLEQYMLANHARFAVLIQFSPQILLCHRERRSEPWVWHIAFLGAERHGMLYPDTTWFAERDIFMFGEFTITKARARQASKEKYYD